tara:strand:+ start:540 stop:1343 length:804 start_codon:yes stop_codon:yes gene_type:complete
MAMSALQASWAVLKDPEAVSAYERAWGRPPKPELGLEAMQTGATMPTPPTKDPDQPFFIDHERGRPSLQDRIRSLPNRQDMSDSMRAAWKNLRGGRDGPAVTRQDIAGHRDWKKALEHHWNNIIEDRRNKWLAGGKRYTGHGLQSDPYTYHSREDDDYAAGNRSYYPEDLADAGSWENYRAGRMPRPPTPSGYSSEGVDRPTMRYFSPGPHSVGPGSGGAYAQLGRAQRRWDENFGGMANTPTGRPETEPTIVTGSRSDKADTIRGY